MLEIQAHQKLPAQTFTTCKSIKPQKRDLN